MMNGLLTLDAEANRWVDQSLGAMNLNQKIGQLMVFAHYGTFITPDVEEMIRKYHVGGLRIAQKFAPGCGDYRSAGKEAGNGVFDRPATMPRIACTAEEFARTLNTLREMAMDRSGSIPLHTAFDQEGEGADFLFEQRFFPFPMGQAASGDPDLAYRIALALGRQTHALGANMIHSPVLDVNTEPTNPEIGPRSYGEDPDTVTRFALASLLGFSEAGIAAAGKHFPGRGHSNTDAHFGLPEIGLDRDTLMAMHVAPFKALIDAGMPCIMAAFTAYPALAASGRPGAVCPEIITELLREELGFTGVVTSDNIQMGGLLSCYNNDMGEAAVNCLIAGCDLILCRAYDSQRIHVLESVKRAVCDCRYPESQLDVSVKRILEMRWKMGLVQNGGVVDAVRAGDAFRDPDVIGLAEEAAARSTVLLRDRKSLLPLSLDKSVLLIEQIHHFHSFVNNTYSHPGMLWEEMRKLSPNVEIVAVQEKITEEDMVVALQRAKQADIIVSTSYYNYRSHAIMIPFLEKLRETGKPLVVVSNMPYPKFGVPEWVDSAVVSFCPSGRENLSAVADILFGKRKASARLSGSLAG